MRKIVFVNRYFYPDQSGTGQLLGDLAFHLAERNSNMAVEVVTGRQTYNAPVSGLPHDEVVRGVHVKRLWTTRFGRNRLPGRAIDYVTFYLNAALYLLKTLKAGDLAVAETDPPLISVITALAAKMRGTLLINWIQDLFPEVATAARVRGTGLVGPVLTAVRNMSLRFARVNVVLGERMADELRALGIPGDRIRIVHNWADGREITSVPHELNELRETWKFRDRFVVGYSGNMGRVHEFDTIVRAAALLRDRDRIVFVFIGDGAKRPELEMKVRRHGLNNVLFKPYQDRSRLARSLSAIDLHVISLNHAFEGLVVPSKFYGAAAAGRPVMYIGDPDGEVARIIGSEECGCVGRIGDPEGVAAEIERLSHDPVLVRRMGQRARRVFERCFDARIAMEAWREIVDMVSTEV